MISKNCVKNKGSLQTREESISKNYDLTELEALCQKGWKTESYENTAEAIRNSISHLDSRIIVHNSHDSHESRKFPADISVAISSYLDDILYGLLYFVQLKPPGTRNLFSPKNCGQILDYASMVREKQPQRSSFVAILSDLQTAYLF